SHRGVHRPDAHSSDLVVLDLQYLHAMAVDAQADTAVGDVFQALGDQAVECLGAVLGQVPVQLPVDVPQVDAAVDQEGAVSLGMNVMVGRQQVGGELADDFLQDVLQGDQPDHIAVFVHDKANAPLVLLEIQQLCGQRGV